MVLVAVATPIIRLVGRQVAMVTTVAVRLVAHMAVLVVVGQEQTAVTVVVRQVG